MNWRTTTPGPRHALPQFLLLVLTMRLLRLPQVGEPFLRQIHEGHLNQ